jgi:hypothetical protein
MTELLDGAFGEGVASGSSLPFTMIPQLGHSGTSGTQEN